MTALQTKVLETERLLLRHLTMDDLDDLFALYSDVEVTKHIPDAPRSYAETREELDWIIDVYYGRYGFGLWATTLKETGAFIGRSGLIPWTIEEREEVEVAYALARKYWGQGLGTEAAQAIVHYAFEHLHLPRLICLVLPENQASIQVARKIGMTFERQVEVDGVWVRLHSANTKEKTRYLPQNI